jgi:hypothetical protein
MRKVLFTTVLLALAGMFAYSQTGIDSIQIKADSLRTGIREDRQLYGQLKKLSRTFVDDVNPVLLERYYVKITYTAGRYVNIGKKEELKRDMKNLLPKIELDRRELARLQGVIRNYRRNKQGNIIINVYNNTTVIQETDF